MEGAGGRGGAGRGGDKRPWASLPRWQSGALDLSRGRSLHRCQAFAESPVPSQAPQRGPTPRVLVVALALSAPRSRTGRPRSQGEGCRRARHAGLTSVSMGSKHAVAAAKGDEDEARKCWSGKASVEAFPLRRETREGGQCP